jgi:hypothetical protein
MSVIGPGNPFNPRVGCVSSSKLPKCPMVERNFQFDGYICTNATAGEDIPKGAVLRQSSTVDREMVQTTTVNDIFVLGVAVENAVSGRQVCMAVGGEFQVLVEGPVNRGDFLSTSFTTGVANSTGTGGDTGDFAISLVTDSSTAVRLIPARFKKSEVF